MINWLKKQLIAISFAMYSVEKNAFSQKSDGLDIDILQEQKNSQGTLMNSLLNGVITKETKTLLWRTYKVLQASDHVITTVVGYDENNNPITQTRKKNRKKFLDNVKLDSFDDYPLDMVINNDEITLSSSEALDNDGLIVHDAIINTQDNGEQNATHAIISGNTYYSTHKGEKPIKINRIILPKFELEKYVTKLCIRKIDDIKYLLEFYTSSYPDDYNRNSRLFISEIKKAINNPRHSDFLDIKSVEFTTYKSLGVDNFLTFKYDIISFDKIVEFNGSYVIKFISEVKLNGYNILEKHRMDELDEKYNNKEVKKLTYVYNQ